MNTTLALRRDSVLPLIALVAVALLAPIFLRQQIVVGTIVNAALITATIGTGIRGGLLVGVLPSTIALVAGTLPPSLMPMVPFIVMANSLLVLVVGLIGRRHYWSGLATAGIVKFAFLYAASALVMDHLLGIGLPQAVLGAMSWPQLATALLGGIAALAVTRAWNPAAT